MFVIETMNDNQLVQKFIEGDEAALEILVRRYKDQVFTYIYMVVKNQHLAEDIFQDTFIKVIRSLKTGKYTDNGKFISWVLRIAHNLIIDHFRKEKLFCMISNENYDYDMFNASKYSDENIEEVIIRKQIEKDIRKLIGELPDDQRQVLIMRYYLGLSFKEIAKRTDVSINTALGRMRYGLINLRKIAEKKNLFLSAI